MLVNDSGYLDKSGTINVKAWDSSFQLFRPKYDFNKNEWFEDATTEEIDKISQQIDNYSVPTDKERIAKLEEEKSILAENVYRLASIIEAMLGGE